MMPGGYSLVIYRGDTHAWRFLLWQDAAKTIPADLNGIAAKGEIRDRPAGTVIQALTVVITQPNIIDASLTAAETGQIPMASGRWDLQLTDQNGVVSTILAGAVNVTGDITDSTGEPVRAVAPARRVGYPIGAGP